MTIDEAQEAYNKRMNRRKGRSKNFIDTGLINRPEKKLAPRKKQPTSRFKTIFCKLTREPSRYCELRIGK